MKRILIILSLLPVHVNAANLYDEFPDEIDANAKYVIYSHGYIVEGTNPRPVHPRWGVYDFPRIKDAMRDNSYHLIAHHRPQESDPIEFAEELARGARSLMEKGVRPENITFAGFSRGGFISILVSNSLKMNKMNFAILAGCGDYINANESVNLYGNVLSIRETSDDLVDSCGALATRSDELSNFEEISITTGKEHGAFYYPLIEWLGPLKKWLKREDGFKQKQAGLLDKK